MLAETLAGVGEKVPMGCRHWADWRKRSDCETDNHKDLNCRRAETFCGRSASTLLYVNCLQVCTP